MKYGSQELMLLKKEFEVILAYLDLIFVFALSRRRQNCNYSRSNKGIGLKFSGNVYN